MINIIFKTKIRQEIENTYESTFTNDILIKNFTSIFILKHNEKTIHNKNGKRLRQIGPKMHLKKL